jgi:hypothetical protein
MGSRYRHEDVAAVPGGWKVRTVKAGSHRVRVAFPPGRKQKGSGRLVSVLHPLFGGNPCANACSMRAANPAELMVMSANHPPRRRNAEARQQRDASKISRTLQKLADKAEKHSQGHLAEAYREMARQNPAELLIMGANPRRSTLQKEARERAERIRAARLHTNPRVELYRSENPSAEVITEQFSGRPLADWYDVDYEPHMPKGKYAHLGDLVGLTIKPMHAGQVQGIAWWDGPANAHEIEHYSGPLKKLVGEPELFVDESARQLYLVKGGQNLSESMHVFGPVDRGNGLFELGHGRVIRYRSKKSVEDSGLIDWVHKLGEENGVHPKIIFDVTHKRILFEGGDYRIEGFWIMN